MTSAQYMLTGRIARTTGLLTLAVILASITACERKTLNSPIFLEAPYAAPQTWAVAPFTNESGVSYVKGERIADFMAEQAQQVYGIDAIPVNRVLLAMRKHGLTAIHNAGEARLIMNTLNVDGLLVGTVTSYHAYRPPKLGLATQLFLREQRSQHRTIDPRLLQKSTAGEVSPGEIGHQGPVAQAAGVFDAANHQTLLWLQQYAEGRTMPDTAYGSDIYLVNMDLYTQFVCFRLLQDLLASEYARVPLPTVDDR